MTMRTIKTLAALLTVFGAAVANASVDSASRSTTYCKVLAQEGADIYKVIYQASQKEDVSISFKNTYDELVHLENVKATEGFAKKFDLANLPEGAYEVEITSPSYAYKGSVEVGDATNYAFIVKDLKERKVALLGTKSPEKDLTVFILDANGEEIYKESVKEESEIKKQFQFGPYVGKEVTFILYHGSKLVKQETIQL